MVTAAIFLFMIGAQPEPPTYTDKEPPAATFQGPSSSRLARPVLIRPGKKFTAIVPVVRQGKPGADFGTTDAASRALYQFSLASARRHFEEAAWAPTKTKSSKAKKRSKAAYEVVITRVTVEAAVGPSYNVIVEVDRVEKGRRRGSATGRGFAQPDRSNQRRAAAFAPGLLGMVASKKASRPVPEKDAAVIEQATVRALDSALLQLAAVWAGEQYVEDLRKKSR